MRARQLQAWKGKSLVLYNYTISICSMKTRLAMNEFGLEFEDRQVDIGFPSGITFGRGGRGVVRLTQGSNGGSPVTRNAEIDPGDNDHHPPA